MIELQNTGNAVARSFDNATHSLNRAADKLADVSRHAAHALEARGDQLRYAQTRAAREARHFVQDKPLTSIGLAVAAGFLLSWALSRSQRQD